MGAFYTVTPRAIPGKMGILPRTTETFELADGKAVRRPVGLVEIRIDGRDTITEAVFGMKRDAALLGVATIERMGFNIDPIRHRLVPIRKFLLHLLQAGGAVSPVISPRTSRPAALSSPRSWPWPPRRFP